MRTLNLTLPGNPRYQPKNLQPYFGYDNNFRFVAEVEIATMKTLAEIGVIPKSDIDLLTTELEEKLLGITTTEVDDVERNVTKHDIRAWVQIAQEILPPALRRWVHVPLTSYDALDTARSLQFYRAHDKVVRPLVLELIGQLERKAYDHASTVQIGRTHGQHALPVTIGFWLSTILSRIMTNFEQTDSYSCELNGKISGAVGAYNAQVGLGISRMCEGGFSFEERVLQKLDLDPGLISTQILQPEPLAYYLFSATMLSGAIGQLGRDCRHLMRTEIGEIGEPFSANQVGSSTMAHKRNPINFENCEGMFLRNLAEFQKVTSCLISEHQRDLVGSSLARDFPTIIINLVHQLNTLLRKDSNRKSFIERITIDEAACARNFQMQSGVIMAEPIYIALQMAGYTEDAHKLVNHKAVPLAHAQNISLRDAVGRLADDSSELQEAIRRIPVDVWKLLAEPDKYIGHAVEKTLEVSKKAQTYTKQ